MTREFPQGWTGYVELTRTAQGKRLDCNRMALAMDSDVSFPLCISIKLGCAGLCEHFLVADGGQ